LNKTQRVFAHEFKGTRHDVGYKFGYLKTTIEYGLTHPDVKDDLRAYIKDLGVELTKQDNTTNTTKANKKTTK